MNAAPQVGHFLFFNMTFSAVRDVLNALHPSTYLYIAFLFLLELEEKSAAQLPSEPLVLCTRLLRIRSYVYTYTHTILCICAEPSRGVILSTPVCWDGSPLCFPFQSSSFFAGRGMKAGEKASSSRRAEGDHPPEKFQSEHAGNSKSPGKCFCRAYFYEAIKMISARTPIYAQGSSPREAPCGVRGLRSCGPLLLKYPLLPLLRGAEIKSKGGPGY